VPNAVRRLGKDRGIPFLKMILEDAFDIGCQFCPRFCFPCRLHVHLGRGGFDSLLTR